MTGSQAMIVLVLLALAAPSRAQAQAADWTFVEAPDRNAVIAFTEFDNGIVLASRCTDGVFDVSVNGLPRVRGFVRTLRVSIGDEALRDETWTVANDPTAAFSRLPASLARRLAAGGQLQIGVPGVNGQRGIRYVMDLPPSPTSLERALTTCGRSLIDPRDASLERDAPDGLSPGVLWVTTPRVIFPGSVQGRYVTQASVTVSCRATDAGQLTDCVIESEHPGGYRFGDAVIRAVRRARVKSEVAGASIDGRILTFTTNFQMR